MDETQRWVNVYKAHNLEDCKLRDTEDLKLLHGIDYTAVQGYCNLNIFSKNLYKNFIVNFYNMQGLEKRADIIPKSINFVEDTESLAKEDAADDYYVVVRRTIEVIKNDSSKSILHEYIEEKYKHLEVSEIEKSQYLRFEYRSNDYHEWVHVLNPHEWY